MGAILCCCRKNEDEERTPLIGNPPARNSRPRPLDTNLMRCRCDEAVPPSPVSELIVHTALTMLDVAAPDYELDQKEVEERTKAYSDQLNSITNWSPPAPPQTIILTEVEDPETVFSTEPISKDTLNLISSALALVTEAVESIKVEPVEDVVVPFRTPMSDIPPQDESIL